MYTIPFSHVLYDIAADPDQWLLAKIDTVQRILPANSMVILMFFQIRHMMEHMLRIIIYPDPYSIKIIDQSGIIRKELNATDPIVKINLNDLTKGVYHVVISSDDDKERFQLIKI